MMSTETSSEWLLRRKAELAAKDLNTKDRCSNIMVLNVHFQVPALKYTRFGLCDYFIEVFIVHRHVPINFLNL